MPRPIVRATCVFLIASLFFACSLFRHRPPPPPPAPPSPTVTPTPEPSPTPAPHHHRRRRRHNHEAAETPSPTPAFETSPSGSPTPTLGPALPTPTASPTPTGPARISIGGENTDKSGVEQQVERTEAILDKVNVNSANLSSDDKAAYDQARSLLSAAQTAQRQGDYLAASSLAQKASVLSDRFNESASP